MQAVIFAAACVLSYVMVRGVRRGAVLDIPNERSSHTTPTPRGGGIGIVVMTIGGMLVLQQPRVLIVCGVIIAAVSWLDDLRGVPTLIRFAVHLGVAIATVMLVPLHHGLLVSVLAVIWIAGLTNAYNFMDGIDGIAGLQAVIAGLGWVLLAKLAGIAPAATIGLLIAGSSLGFLVQNWQPAKIFMGDVGAAFLGYEFAALAVLAAQRGWSAGAAGVLLVWPFVFDTGFTLLRRALRGERFWSAHRSHLYQRLNQSGWSHARVTLLYGALALAGVAVAAVIVLQTRGLPLAHP